MLVIITRRQVIGWRRDLKILTLCPEGQVAHQLLHRVQQRKRFVRHSKAVSGHKLTDQTSERRVALQRPAGTNAMTKAEAHHDRAAVFGYGDFPSCASKTKTVRSTMATSIPMQPQAATITAMEITKTKEPSSLLGRTAHAVGRGILFPFRLIGDAAGLIV